jgi:hypothetical protein
VEFFENKCDLPIGPSEGLAKLARKFAGGETIGMVQKARKLTLEEALFKEGLTEESQHGLSALTEEERIRILHHIGTKPLPDDQYSRLTSVIDGWNLEESILSHPDKTFKFPVIKQNSLFVRKCYHELYKIIIQSANTTDDSLRILLTGTPGIRKSTFLIYFIIRYLYEQKRDILIFQPAGSTDEFYAFASPNIVRKGTYEDFEAFFLLSTTWYLVDWKPVSRPKNTPATTLFALSPNSIRDDDFKDFEKVLYTSFCMPVWTYDELEECRYHVFPDPAADGPAGLTARMLW